MDACCGKKNDGKMTTRVCTWESTKNQVMKNLLSVLMMLGVFFGIAIGLILRNSKLKTFTHREIMYIQFLGELFVRILNAIIVPLIVSSLVTAIGSLDLSVSGKIGSRTIFFYAISTLVAVGEGVFIVTTVRPGKGVSIGGCGSNPGLVVDTFLDLLRNIFPPNIIGATVEATRTKLLQNNTLPVPEWIISIDFVKGTNMMGVIIISAAFGAVLGRMGEKGKPILNFFASVGDATIIFTTKVVILGPVCICFLVIGEILKVKSTSAVFRNLGSYVGCVVTGLTIHILIIIPSTYYFITGKNPFTFLGGMTEAIATSLGTASSLATLPVTLKCAEEFNKIDHHVSRFVIPIGATLNMDGTALFLPIVLMYLGQMCGMDLSVVRVIGISLVAAATSVGAAGIPQSGLIIMMTAFTAIGFPYSFLAYVIPVDWMLERLRATVNILGDAFVAGIVAHLSRRELALINEREINVVDVFAQLAALHKAQLTRQHSRELANEQPQAMEADETTRESSSDTDTISV